MKIITPLFLKSIIHYPFYLTPNENYIYKSNVFSFSTSTISDVNRQGTSNLLNYDNIYNLALMSYNAYIKPNAKDWYQTPYNVSQDISINPETVQGYLFSDETNKIHVISIKGTSIGWFNFLDVKNDKFNDNLFLSCCYYKQSSIFKGNYSCNIESEKHICSKECYENSKDFDINYLNIVNQIGLNLEKIIDFENDDITFTGHSLGAILATYLGMKYKKPVVGFEAPGGKHYFNLIGMNTDGHDQIYHFGHNADTIFMGKCHDRTSICYIGGYIIRTKCHVGKTCIYDSIGKLGISESILTHRMKYVIDKIIPNWADNDEFPECIDMSDCTDCDQWTYI
jgi:lipase ATG15